MKNLNIKSILFGVLILFVTSSIFYSCLSDSNENKLLSTSQLNFVSYNENLNTEKCDKWHCGPACKPLVEVKNDDYEDSTGK